MRTAFTLIELLVVVTIIVVLLTLLTPALDKAIYEAELAVCGTHLRTIATGVQTYAVDFKRRYPYRKGVHDATNTTDAGGTFLATGAWHPHKIWNGASDGNQRDDRKLLRNYFGINAALNDPLAQKADFEGARPGSQTYATYYLWFGYKFAGQNGMDKLGDRLTWTEPSNPPVVSRFDVLAGDHDDVRVRDSLPGTTASHPDHDRKLASRLYQDAGSPTSVLARWDAAGGTGRGAMEMNFVFAAGDVQRLNAVALDADERTVKVPVFNGATHTLTQWSHLPKR